MDDIYYKHCAEFIRSYDRDRFICSLLISKKVRAYYIVLAAFNIEISRILYNVTDEIIMPSLICLKWWNDKICQIYNNEKCENNHPVLLGLREIIKNKKIDYSFFKQYLCGCETVLCEDYYLDVNGLKFIAEKTTVNFMKIVCEVLNVASKVDDISYYSGLSWNLMTNLRNERAFNKLNKSLLPKDLLQEVGLSIQDISNVKYKKIICEIVEFIVIIIQGYVDQVDNSLKRLPRNDLISVFLENRIISLYLERIRKKKYDIISGDIGNFSFIMQLKLLYKYYVFF